MCYHFLILLPPHLDGIFRRVKSTGEILPEIVKSSTCAESHTGRGHECGIAVTEHLNENSAREREEAREREVESEVKRVFEIERERGSERARITECANKCISCIFVYKEGVVKTL